MRSTRVGSTRYVGLEVKREPVVSAQSPPQSEASNDRLYNNDMGADERNLTVLRGANSDLSATEEERTVGRGIDTADDDYNNPFDGSNDDPLQFPGELTETKDNMRRVALAESNQLDIRMRSVNEAVRELSKRSSTAGVSASARDARVGSALGATRAGDANRLRDVHNSLRLRHDSLLGLANSDQEQELALDRKNGARWGTSIAQQQRGYLEAREAEKKAKATALTQPSQAAHGSDRVQERVSEPNRAVQPEFD